MTVHWYRPSQCILTLVAVSSVLVIAGCLACSYVLYFAPEEPSKNIDGGDYIFIPAICLVVCSGLTVITLLLGCCGICKDSKIVLIIFAVASLVVAGIQVGSISSAFTFTMNGKVSDAVSTILLKDLLDFPEHAKSQNIFSVVQDDYNCCGIKNYTDWRTHNTSWSREANGSAYAPISCCTSEHKNNETCNTNTETLKQQGCLDVLIDRMKIVTYPIFAFSLALGLLQVATSLMSCYGALLINRYENYDVL